MKSAYLPQGRGSATQPSGQPRDVRVYRAPRDAAVKHAAGIQTTPLVAPADGAGWLCGVSVYAAGVQAPLHRHNCAERIVVLSGQAELRVDGLCWQLGPHDVGWIPADLDHGYRNTGADDLHLLWIYDRDDATRTAAGAGIAVPMLDAGATAPSPGDTP